MQDLLRFSIRVIQAGLAGFWWLAWVLGWIALWLSCNWFVWLALILFKYFGFRKSSENRQLRHTPLCPCSNLGRILRRLAPRPKLLHNLSSKTEFKFLWNPAPNCWTKLNFIELLRKFSAYINNSITRKLEQNIISNMSAWTAILNAWRSWKLEQNVPTRLWDYGHDFESITPDSNQNMI